MAQFDGKTKSRTFVFVCYGDENIIAAKSELIDDFIPFCYMIHDQDTDENGDIKVLHAHFMIDYGNTTTLQHIRKSYGHLAANGVIFPVFKARQQYDYFWHDPRLEKSKGKFVYDKHLIKCFNGFDPDELTDWTENEKTLLMDAVMEVANNQKIFEYAGLLEYFSQNNREIYKFCMNNTILVNGYMTSHRNRNKKGGKDNS